MAPTPTREQIELWLAKARRNVEMAEGALGLGHWESCVFWCEQAAEVYLKALYMASKRTSAPKTHRLVWFAGELGLGDEFLTGLHDLERDYMMTRYPDVGVTAAGCAYTAETAADRLQWALRIRDWVRSRLPEEVGEDGDDHGDAGRGTAPPAS